MLIGGGGGGLISFEIRLISKEINQAEPEYVNMHSLLINPLDLPLFFTCIFSSPNSFTEHSSAISNDTGLIPARVRHIFQSAHSAYKFRVTSKQGC